MKTNQLNPAALRPLYEALEDLFASYKALADSGDAGNWRIEDCPEGQQVIEAIRLATLPDEHPAPSEPVLRRGPRPQFKSNDAQGRCLYCHDTDCGVGGMGCRESMAAYEEFIKADKEWYAREFPASDSPTSPVIPSPIVSRGPTIAGELPASDEAGAGSFCTYIPFGQAFFWQAECTRAAAKPTQGFLCIHCGKPVRTSDAFPAPPSCPACAPDYWIHGIPGTWAYCPVCRGPLPGSKCIHTFRTHPESGDYCAKCNHRQYP